MTTNAINYLRKIRTREFTMARESKYTHVTKDGKRNVNPGFERLQCFLPDKLLKKLKIAAINQDRDISEIVAEALTEHLKRRGK